MSRTYDVAQICLNGHVINSSARTMPQFNQEYCDKCGQPTITKCPQCNTDIRGAYLAFVSLGEMEAPAYCLECGAPFPWTESRLQAIESIIDELDELDETDRNLLKDNLSDIAFETPKSQLAEQRWKRIIKKLGRDSYEGLRALVVDIASETAKKTLYGP